MVTLRSIITSVRMHARAHTHARTQRSLLALAVFPF